jgi:hypothetical protein
MKSPTSKKEMQAASPGLSRLFDIESETEYLFSF